MSSAEGSEDDFYSSLEQEVLSAKNNHQIESSSSEPPPMVVGKSVNNEMVDLNSSSASSEDPMDDPLDTSASKTNGIVETNGVDHADDDGHGQAPSAKTSTDDMDQNDTNNANETNNVGKEKQGAESSLDTPGYKCEYCDKKFSNLASRNMHSRKSHPDMAKLDAVAETSMSSKPVQGPNINTKSPKLARFDCEICLTSYQTRNHLHRHYETVMHRNNVKNHVKDEITIDDDDDDDDEPAPAVHRPQKKVAAPPRPTSRPAVAKQVVEYEEEDIETMDDDEGSFSTSSPSRTPYPCQVCSTSYSSSSALKRHQRTGLHKNNVKAVESGGAKVYNNSKPASPTKVSAIADDSAPDADDGNGTFDCETCNTSYESKKSLHRHYKTPSHLNHQAAAIDYRYGCDSCTSVFPTSIALESHFKAVHMNGDDDGDVGQEDEDVESESDSDSEQIRRVAKSPAIKARVGKTCETCNMTFRDNYKLRRHYQSQSHQSKLKNDDDDAGDGDVIENIDDDDDDDQVVVHKQQIKVNTTPRKSLTHAASSSPAKVGKKLICDVCGTSYCSPRDLRRHYETKTHLAKLAELEKNGGSGGGSRAVKRSASPPSKPVAQPQIVDLSCKTCNKKFTNAASLNMHNRKSHPELTPAPTPAASSKPTPPKKPKHSSTTKTWYDVDGLDDDDVSDGHVAANICEVELDESQYKQTRKHQKNPGKYPCKVCGTAYTKGSDRTRHYETLKHKQNVAKFGDAGGDDDDDMDPDDNEGGATVPAPKTQQVGKGQGHVVGVVDDDDDEEEMETGTTHEGGKGQGYSCADCNTDYHSRRALYRHFETQLHKKNVLAGGVSPAAAAKIPTKSVAARKSYEGYVEDDDGVIFNDEEAEPDPEDDEIRAVGASNRHKKVPGQRKSYACEPCGAAFPNPSKLARHNQSLQHRNNLLNRSPLSTTTPKKLASSPAKSSTSSGAAKILKSPAASAPNANNAGGKRNYPCKTCGTFYLSSSHLERHKLTKSHINKLFGEPEEEDDEEPGQIGIDDGDDGGNMGQEEYSD